MFSHKVSSKFMEKISMFSHEVGSKFMEKISMFSHEVVSKFIRFGLVSLLNLGPT